MLRLHGEAGSVAADIGALRDELRGVSRPFLPDDVINIDESGLFYNLEPSRVLVDASRARGQRGNKMDKTRITFMTGCNASGCEWAPTQVIAKAARPQTQSKWWGRKKLHPVMVWNDLGIVLYEQGLADSGNIYHVS